MTQTTEETNFLSDLAKSFGAKNGDITKLPQLKRDIYNDLAAAANNDGVLSQDKIQEIVKNTIERDVNDAKAGNRKVADLIDLNLFEKGKEIASEKVLAIEEQKAMQADPTHKPGSKISEKTEEKIRTTVNVNDVVTLANNAGLPAKGEPSVSDMIVNAAGDDKILTKKELDTLLKDPKFLAAAAKVDNSKTVVVSNKTGVDNDEITVGSENGGAINLSKIGVKLQDADPKDTKNLNSGFKPGITQLTTGNAR